jgi:hypothetical protein
MEPSTLEEGSATLAKAGIHSPMAEHNVYVQNR